MEIYFFLKSIHIFTKFEHVSQVAVIDVNLVDTYSNDIRILLELGKELMFFKSNSN